MGNISIGDLMRVTGNDSKRTNAGAGVGDEEDDVGTVGRGERRDGEKEKEEGKVAGFHERHSSQIICENPRSSVGICVERSSFTSSRFAIIRGYLRHLR